MSDLLAGTTAGPWFVNPARAWIEVPDRDAPICALLWPTELRSEEETFANGRLIAQAPALATENAALRSLCAELMEACASMIRWDDAEKNARPFDEDNGAGFYARIDMCAEAFEKARTAIAHAKELLP